MKNVYYIFQIHTAGLIDYNMNHIIKLRVQFVSPDIILGIIQIEAIGNNNAHMNFL